MNILEILENGHHIILEAINGLPEADWHVPGVSGDWSAKDIIAHLAAYEQVLVDVLNTLLLKDCPAPTLDRFRQAYVLTFDEDEVARRRDRTVGEVLVEYETAHTQAVALLSQVPAEVRFKLGIPPWDGSPYNLEDFIVYTFYGHKQEHGAQITAFREQRARRPAALRNSRLAGRRKGVFGKVAAFKVNGVNGQTRVVTTNGYKYQPVIR